MATHPVVDVHIHFLPPALAKTLMARTVPPRAEQRGDRLVLDFGDGYVENIDARLTEPDTLHETLRRSGVDIAVVSINQPGVLRLDAVEARAVARDANDELLELVTAGGGAIEGLATLPWQAPDDAIGELERTAALGLKGAMVCSNVAGRALDDASFDPVFEAAATRGMPLLLHPTVPTEVSALREHGLICAAGFLFDTTTAVLRLVFSGTFERHPDLKIVLAHAGSLLPLLAGRADREYARGALPGAAGRGRPPSDDIARLYTDSIAGSPKALELAVDLFGRDHVCFGSDYPFNDQREALDLVHATSLAEDVVRGICGDNACALFALDLDAGGGNAR